MSDVISRFERMINRVNILYGLLFPVGTTTVLVIMLWVMRPAYFQPQTFMLWLIMICCVVGVSAVHIIFEKILTKLQLQLIYLFYQAALLTFTVFIAPYLSPFNLLWIALAIGVDLLFGKQSLRLVLTLYILAMITAFVRTDQSTTPPNVIAGLGQIGAVIFVSLQVSKYRQISDDERRVLDDTSQNSAYERQRLLSLINNMGDAVFATDEKGHILLYNAAVLNLLDTNISLEGKPVSSVVNLRDEKHKKIDLLGLAKKSVTGITTTDYLHEFSDQDRINLYLNIAPIKLGFKQQSESGYIIIMRDVTKEKSLEEERDEFISVVSHELRTPIAIAEGNISNAMYVIESAKEKKLAAEAMKQAHDQVVFLASMINDLATLSRAERSDVVMELKSVDVRELLHNLGKDYENEAVTKNLKLTVTAASDAQPITTNELYLREILQNFITNSLKYTKEGSVILHVRSNKKGDAVFSVADTGIGLSKADQKKVFEKFFRSEDFRTRESSGTGLGLYVTAKLAQKLGAQITLESELNKGSTFTITVPSLKSNKHN